MFRLRLSLAFAVLVALVCSQAAWVYWGANRVDDYARHSRLTGDILAELLDLSANKQRLRVWASQQLMDSGAAPAVRDRLLDQMHAGAARLADMSRRYLESWQQVAARDGIAVPAEAQQLVDISQLLDANIVELQAQLERLQPLARDAQFAGVWQQINQVFDRTHGLDLRELVNGAIERQRKAVPIAREATERGLDRLRRQAILMAVLTFVTALALAPYLSWRVKRPLDRLMAGTRALQAGDLDHRIVLGPRDEFHRVAQHFNAMAAELQQHRREADEARRRLEDAVAARTLELQTAHQTLQLLDQRRRQLFADLSHELRTPATAIRGEAEIALRGGDKPAAEYRQTLARIVGGVKQLTGVVNDLLLIARAEADQLAIRPASLDLPALLRDVADQAHALAELHGMRLHVDEASVAGLAVQADAERLRQAVMIVLDNAIRYSRPGGDVRLGWERLDDSAQIVVRDHGIGIPPHELAAVFERFVRGQRARQHRADGSGIGLSIAQAIVQAHHGTIHVESVPDQGTVVRIVLPCEAAAHAVPSLP
ncbi:MAG TPA: HAMP domain-containing sensor histidine kinase [Burkholderiaceae bacterium]|nr:HAMP domain-containing sensor histidine kinase [Burkholderiaceae bacterium]